MVRIVVVLHWGSPGWAPTVTEYSVDKLGSRYRIDK